MSGREEYMRGEASADDRARLAQNALNQLALRDPAKSILFSPTEWILVALVEATLAVQDRLAQLTEALKARDAAPPTGDER